jgi:DNA-binding PadR family transcriptional regulator
MSLKYILLGLLSQQSWYGYQLRPAAEQILGGQAELNSGQLYTLLKKLAEQQLIVGERVEQEDRPDKRVFAITSSGREALQIWFDSPISAQVMRSDIYLRYVLLNLIQPERCLDFLLEQQRSLLGYIGALVEDRMKCQGNSDVSTEVLRELTLFHAEADLRWIEWLITQQKQGDYHG